MENTKVQNENNIFGINVIYLLLKNILIEKTFNDNFNIDDIASDILFLKNKYLKEFNIISNEEGGEKYHQIDFNENNYNIEKYILQIFNFNIFYTKIPSTSYKNIFNTFKKINNQIKGIKFFENLFMNNHSILTELYTKYDFEKVLKMLVKENDWEKDKEKVQELKNIIISFANFLDCLSKFYQILIEYYN